MKRNLKRVIYTSSYDRGLEHLLKMWPEVRKEVPDATLHIFYGWQLFDQFHKDNPSSKAWKARMEEMMTQPGIMEHGFIAQPKLVDEYKKSGIWAYPTHFGEINCITGLKAQAYGCEPVVVNYAALRETVRYGRRVEGDIYDEETKAKFLKELITALKEPMKEEERKEMMKDTQARYGWETIAKDWDKVFKGV